MSSLAKAVIAWQLQHGRHDLPWQNTTNPYHIWVSEIMLQQTQVSTVFDYYTRFIARFPDVASLANATQEEVLQQWSGLGYYSRARNLHHAAHTIVNDFSGVFPSKFDDIQSLSGIGRSTAAAIVAFAFNQPQPIMDGNVKRVFTRYFLLEGYPGLSSIQKKLWQLAESNMPIKNVATYTQGLMDLGATLCTRSKPNCDYCPLNSNCEALKQNRINELPTPKPRKISPAKKITMLIFLYGNEVMLEKRPPDGIWGGLWSFPEIDIHQIATGFAIQRFGLEVEVLEPLANINHVFTHFKLQITPQPLQVIRKNKQANQAGCIWLSVDDAIGAAIPTPVRKILQTLCVV